MSARKKPGSRRKAGKANAGSFKPGRSGNPAGRPPGGAGLAAYIREQTKDGVELVALHLDVLRGTAEGDVMTEGGVRSIGPSIKDRQASAAWLADRGFGKAAEQLEVSGEGGLVVRVITLSGGED